MNDYPLEIYFATSSARRRDCSTFDVAKAEALYLSIYRWWSSIELFMLECVEVLNFESESTRNVEADVLLGREAKLSMSNS